MNDTINYSEHTEEQKKLTIIAQLLYDKIQDISNQLIKILHTVRNDEPFGLAFIRTACCKVVLQRIVKIESPMELLREIEKNLSTEESK